MYNISEEEEMLPFIPRVNDVYWMSDPCERRIRKRLRKCLKENGCGSACPFTNAKGMTDIKNSIIVHRVIFAANCHEVKLTLREPGIVRNQIT